MPNAARCSGLLAHALELSRLMQTERHAHLVAGTYDWFSWRPRTLESVAWGRTRSLAHFAERSSLSSTKCDVWGCNCSPGGGGYIFDGWDVREAPPRAPADPAACFGPFAFAKGALKFYSTAAVRWVVSSPRFAPDVEHATSLHEQGRLPERVSEDAQLGFLFAQHPTLRLVHLVPFAAWCNSWHHVGDWRHTLSAHRAPWGQYKWLTKQLKELWNGGSPPPLEVHAQCSGRPPCRDCAHAPGQRVCSLQVSLPKRTSPSVSCRKCVCTATVPVGGTSTSESPGGCQWQDKLEDAVRGCSV